MTLCTTDRVCGTGACDQVIRGKAGSSNAVGLLHDLLQEPGENMRGYAAHCLQCIAEEPQVGLGSVGERAVEEHVRCSGQVCREMWPRGVAKGCGGG